MLGESGTSKTGKIYYYYKCQGVKRGLGCKTKSSQKEEIELGVLYRVVEQFFSDGCIVTFVNEFLKQEKRKRYYTFTKK